MTTTVVIFLSLTKQCSFDIVALGAMQNCMTAMGVTLFYGS